MGIGQQARMVRCAVLWHGVTECAGGGGGLHSTAGMGSLAGSQGLRRMACAVKQWVLPVT